MSVSIFPFKKGSVRISPAVGIAVLLSILCFLPTAARAQDAANVTAADQKSPYQTLIRTLTESYQSEKGNLTDLKDEIAQVKKQRTNLVNEINTHSVQLSVHRNLLNLEKVPVDELERAQSAHAVSLAAVQKRYDELKEKKQILEQKLTQAQQQYEINEKQLTQISQENTSGRDAQEAVDHLQDFMKLLREKIGYLQQLEELYAEQLDQVGELRDNLSAFSTTFKNFIDVKRKEALFTRRSGTFPMLSIQKLTAELEGVRKTMRRIAAPDYRKALAEEVGNRGGFLLVTLPLLVFLVVFFLVWIKRRGFARIACDPERCRWGGFTLKLLRRSIVMAGTLLTVHIVCTIQELYVWLPILRPLIASATVWLCTRWIKDFVMLRRSEFPASSVPGQTLPMVNRNISLFRYIMIVYILASWFLGHQSAVMLLFRIVMEMFLLVRCILTWRRFHQQISAAGLEPTRRERSCRSTVEVISYLVLGGSVVSELFGYGYFAIYWFFAWSMTGLIGMWSGLILLSLKELEQMVSIAADVEKSRAAVSLDSFKWFGIRVSWVVWGLVTLTALVWVWGGQDAILLKTFNLLNTPLNIQGFNLNLMGFVYAFVVLSGVHILSHIWRHFLLDVVLSSQKMERGFKASITSISVYVFWGIGILISLGLVGVNTTSLAVVFGAFSVGLGFGLQNIFNNFISGLILLFERPIQPGDAIEINGIWGEVVKINIRSTHVQTYDNASLIIPNSEFVSSQVTNWSFKDKRLRRKLLIGVAYGSDLPLVRETMLEAVRRAANVLPAPSPDVVFMEFADSSINFMLRYWTHVDYYFSTQTEILFDIDRMFRERGIQIPFPQRDIYIKSMPRPVPEEPEEEGSEDPQISLVRPKA